MGGGVLVGVGVEGVEGFSLSFFVVSLFFFAIILFFRLPLILLEEEKTTAIYCKAAKMGNFTLTLSGSTPCKTSRVFPVLSKDFILGVTIQGPIRGRNKPLLGHF